MRSSLLEQNSLSRGTICVFREFKALMMRASWSYAWTATPAAAPPVLALLAPARKKRGDDQSVHSSVPAQWKKAALTLCFLAFGITQT